MSDIGCAVNTDRELYREPDETGNGSFYSDSIHVTQGGGIGINVGGHVFVKTLRAWHALAAHDNQDLQAPVSLPPSPLPVGVDEREYRLVPVEPTEAMLKAGEANCRGWWTGGRTTPVYGNEPGFIYKAMLAAIPAVPTTLAKEELIDRVALAINRQWNATRDVPFPLYQAEAEMLARAAIAATPPSNEREKALEEAAKWIDRRREFYQNEHGSTDPETGATEYPGNGDEYVGELEEIADGIRALVPSSPANGGKS